MLLVLLVQQLWIYVSARGFAEAERAFPDNHREHYRPRLAADAVRQLLRQPSSALRPSMADPC